jgi:hypothetical protein
MYTRDSIESLRKFVSLRDILTDIGGVPYSEIIDSSTEFRCACPLHHGDQKTKQCGDFEVTRDVFGFVSLKLGISFIEAVELLANKYHFTLEQGADEANVRLNLECANRSKFMIDRLHTLQELPGYSNDKRDWSLIIEYLKLRNYKDLEAIKLFNLYPCIDAVGKLRLGIPSYDDSGNLVGVNARRLDSLLDYDDTDPKYRLIKGYKKGSILYNLNNAKQYSVTDGVIVVEGELSTIRMNTYGYANTVCCMGNTLTPQQIALLYKYTFKVVFLVEEGEAASQGVFASIKRFIPNTMTLGVAYLSEGDPDDNAKESIDLALKSTKYVSAEKHQKLIKAA